MMDIALLLARLLLAGVFALAGVAKLADRSGTRWAAIDFGVPARLASPLAILLPLAELAVAAALIPQTTAFLGTIGALALLILFIAGISLNLARGHKPECNCFGQVHSSPAGWKTLGRNGVLAVVAGFVLWQGDAGPSAFAWVGSLSAIGLLVLVVGLVVLGLVAAQWWILVNLFRQNGRLLVRLDAVEKRLDAAGLAPADPSEDQPEEQRRGLPLGSPAPAFGLPGLYGETHTLDSLRASDKPVVLLFTDPDCGPCTALLPEIGRWQREHPDAMTLSLISRGTPEENRAKTTEHGVQRVLLQEDEEVAEAYQVSGTPSAALVNPDGTIAGFLVEGPEEIASLVAHLAEGRMPCPDCGGFHDDEGPEGKEIGEAAPEIELPDLDGRTQKLSDFRGIETLVLFWSPDCGFCEQMLDDLKDWENNPPKGAPELLVVSGGTAEANEAMGLGSPVVLDEGFSSGREFGASGTPSAVLVDAEGKVASEVVVGGPAVLELAGVRQAQA